MEYPSGGFYKVGDIQVVFSVFKDWGIWFVFKGFVPDKNVLYILLKFAFQGV